MRTRSFLRRLANIAVPLASVVFALCLVVSPVLGVKEAKADCFGMECDIVIPGVGGLPVTIGSNVYEEVKNKVSGLFNTLTVAGMTTLFNSLQSITQRLAKDLANALLSGDPGQSPMFNKDTYKDYWKNVGEQAASRVIDDLNSGLKDITGINLCEPINPGKLSLSLKGFKAPEELKTTCGLKEISASFKTTKDNFQNIKEVNDVVSASYDPSASDIGVALDYHSQYLTAQTTAIDSATLDREETGGMKHVKDMISGEITTPAESVKNSMMNMDPVGMNQKQTSDSFNAAVGNAFELGFTNLGLITASTFVNTLVSGLFQKIVKGINSPSVNADGTQFNLADSQAVTNRNVAAAQSVFSDLLTPNLISTDKQDFIVEMSACPDARGMWNCAMDQDLATGLRTNGGTGAVTVGQAAHMESNGKVPTNPQFLHPDWELVPSSDVKDDTDPSCYQRAYCSSNLAKLRYARILPVGWELAANSQFNSKNDGKYITLGEVIRGFSICNDQGVADAAHPWCKLIDPNWVLTAPPFQCRVKGYGDSIIPGTNIRLQECADAASCLKRDDKGACIGGYGFCVAEKPVWRFSADQCLERFASCRTYVNSTGVQVSYIRNTIDYGSCAVDNVGCMWYASVRNGKDITGQVWTDQKMYFDRTVQPCSGADDGCTKVLETTVGASALNLVPNSSFEQGGTQNDPNALSDWTVDAGAGAVMTDSAVNGSRSYSFTNLQKHVTSPAIVIAPARSYTLSFYARPVTTSTSAGFNAVLHLYTKTGAPIAQANIYHSAGCSSFGQAFIGIDEGVQAGDSGDWKRYVCSFASAPDVATTTLVLNAENTLMDAIQLEESEMPTGYVDGVSTNLTERHLKLPPEELGCTGDEKADNPQCANYARMCGQLDAGCNGYIDQSMPFSPEIPATLSAVDLCPASCVGYAEYRKMSSTFDLGRNVDPRLDDPQDDVSAMFVPSTGQQCMAQDVGCEEFTNVEASAQGGEQKAYFSYVQACEKPNDNSATYYTWEGSDTTGYQLRTWSLIKDPSQTPAPPKIVEKFSPDGVLKEPTSCNDTLWASGVDPDCRQVYDANGSVFYRYFSQVVVSSPSCTDYRKSNSDVADCEKTGGAFTPQSNECIYHVIAAQSRSCTAAVAGCRAYLGTTGRNTTVVFQESFKTTSTAAFSAGVLSNEAVLVGDQSLKLTGQGTQNTGTTFTSTPGQLYHATFWAKTTVPSAPASALRVDDVAVGSFSLGVDWQRFDIGPFTTKVATSSIEWVNLPNATFLDEIQIERVADVTYVVKGSWNTPAECDQTSEGLPLPQAMLGCRAYADRNGDVKDVRQFAHLCHDTAIGCKGFVDTRNTPNADAQTFAVTGTPTTTRTGAGFAWDKKYVGDWSATRPADRYVYAIDEARARCSSDADSCRAFGKPMLDMTTMDVTTTQLTGNDAKALGGQNATSVTVAKFETVYLMDNANAYFTNDNEPNILCRKDELFCDQFKSGQTVAYFRNPQDHTCEWRDKVVLKANPGNGIPSDGEYSGWFRKGSDAPCYPGLLSSRNTYLTMSSGDPTYTGWTSLCPAAQSECTEFRDMNDHSDPVHPSGKPYFFIHNQKLDVSSCNGTVDVLNGCVLLRDMSDPRNRWSTTATYSEAAAAGQVPTPPVDCIGDPQNPQCLSHKTCKKVTYTCDNLGCDDPIKATDCVTARNSSGYDCENPVDAATPYCKQWFKYGGCTAVDTAKNVTDASCQLDTDCTVAAADQDNHSSYAVTGKCEVANDSNVVIKVKLDRDCSEWLGCSTAETVYDPTQKKYVDTCTELSLCNQSQGSNAGTFCSQYVDRSKEEVLNPGAFFSADAYVNRTVGFGEADYSGYSIPGEFQAIDLENRLVGKELFADEPIIANRFATDYRLVAAVKESTGLVEFNVTSSQLLHPTLHVCRYTSTGRTGYFNLHGIPGKRTCYFAVDALTSSSDVAVTPGQPTNDPRNIETLSDIMRASVDPKYDIALGKSFPPAECKSYPETNAPFPNLYVKTWDLTVDPAKIKETVKGYEAATLCERGEDCACSYRRVKYSGGQIQKYYSPFGLPPVAGVCSGGKNDGVACVPGETTVETANGTAAGQSTTEDVGCPGGRCMAISDVVLVRGQFGQCLQRDYSRIVADDQGRHPCLIWSPNPILSGTYDAAHFNPLAGYVPPVNSGEYYCLTSANPPIQSVWAAGSHTFMNDSTQRGSADGGAPGDGANPFFMLPGQLSKFNYDVGYIAGECHNTDACGSFGVEGHCNCQDGLGDPQTALDRDFSEMYSNGAGQQELHDHCLGSASTRAYDDTLLQDFVSNPFNFPVSGYFCTDLLRFQDLGVGIDGNKPTSGLGGSESQQAIRCSLSFSNKDVDKSEGIVPNDIPSQADGNRGRWIMTGRGLQHTYMEYFVPVKPVGVASWLSPGTASFSTDDLDQALRERNFAQFQFFPVNDQHAAACSIPPEFVNTSVSVDDWSDPDKVGAASNQVFTQFSKDFDGQLDRSKEHILVNKSNKPVKMDCSGPGQVNYASDANATDPAGQCFYKYWETSYNLDGVSTFEWLNAQPNTSFLSRYTGFYSHERNCSKSGFAIRAMFELADKSGNSIPTTDVTAEQLSGPWNFVGFWITACKVGDDWESSLYLALRVKHADICHELAEVISPYSRQSAAFADRVWADGAFAIPRLGFTYSTQFQPFGSAQATGLPNKEPLFQTNGPVENWSALHPPTFLGSGASYTNTDPNPAFRWAHLTNIFARIYRVYDFYDSAISKYSYVCVQGPNAHKLCPNPPSLAQGGTNNADWKKKVEEACSATGMCDSTLTPQSYKNTVHRCNGLSGVNAGLECGGAFNLPSLDPTCHNAAMRSVGGTLIPQYTSCKPRSTWIVCPASGLWSPGQCGVTEYTQEDAFKLRNAFACGADAVQPGSGCSKPENTSHDCPLHVWSGGVGPAKSVCTPDTIGPMNGRCSNGYENARCSSDADCTFGAIQWWGAYDDGKPKLPGPGLDTALANQPFSIPSLWSYVGPTDSNKAPQAKFLPVSTVWFSNPSGSEVDEGQLPMAQDYSSLRSYYADYGVNNFQDGYPFSRYSRNGAVIMMDYTGELGARYPSPHAANDSEHSWTVGAIVQPGLCEGAIGALMDPANALQRDPTTNTETFGIEHKRMETALDAGLCKGGAYDGQSCFSWTDAYKPSNQTGPWDNTPSCWPPNWNTAPAAQCAAVAGLPGCTSATGDPNSNDPDLDNNACTRSAGYRPRVDICTDLSNEACLIGYDLTNPSSYGYAALSPTDVTSGLHKPSFLGVQNPDPTQETHIAFYAPRPPMVAAPDLTHACESPGKCRISTVGMFSLENKTSGPLVFGGGKAQVAMRFYGWAANDQTPLKDVVIDWGDGTITSIDNARLMNKKPVCGVASECEFAPGLTCNSSADCPPGAGGCVGTGTCAEDSTKICHRDAECNAAGTARSTCNFRTMFGNSDNACEANYYEFTHAYSCDRASARLTSCQGGQQSEVLRCSNNPGIACTAATAATVCGSGDTCIAGLAPPSSEGTGGCYDSVKVACRYTPRLMLKDSFNWCTGDCRSGPVVNGQPTDVTTGPDKSVIRHVYGGCWDGTDTMKNTSVGTPIMGEPPSGNSLYWNECTRQPQGVLPNIPVNQNIRPWIVYPGAVQIGTIQ